jgi:hypothetical protein
VWNAIGVAAEEDIMSGKQLFVGLAVATAMGVVGTASVAFAQDEAGTGSVTPCNLAGINPVDHPKIFGNPDVARQQYGFVKGPNGSWQVIPNCESQIKR